MTTHTISRSGLIMKRVLPVIFTFFVLYGLQAQNSSSQNWPILETGGSSPMPSVWIDDQTGHRVIKLTDRDGSNRSFYFHNNPFIPQLNNEGDLMVFYGSTNKGSQIFTINLKTKETIRITDHPGGVFGEIIDPVHRKVYFQSSDSVYSVTVDDRKAKLEYTFPENFKGGITTLNADGTLLAGAYSGEAKRELLRKYPKKSQFFERIFEAKLPHTLFTIDLQTGNLDKIHTENTWLGHVQFSPTDADVLMYCHEGPWHLVDRIWTIDLASKATKLMHLRSMDMEIAGHEFFSRDGEVIWFDLQLPRGETFYLAGVNVVDGGTQKYSMTRDEWSIHFNISPDQKLFCGDGGDASQVASAENGKWIYLFTPMEHTLQSHKLVNMKNHDYDLEPNVHFSPDGEWVIFRANFEGASNIYAVEISGKDN